MRKTGIPPVRGGNLNVEFIASSKKDPSPKPGERVYVLGL
jgi:hypothetical protein